MISHFFRGCIISVFGKCGITMDWKDLFKHAISQAYILTDSFLRDFQLIISCFRRIPSKESQCRSLRPIWSSFWKFITRLLTDPLDGRAERVTKRNVVCWQSSAKFEGCWREMVVMEWAGTGCDSSIECVGPRWIGLICLWMEPFHYSC